jgi:hypothetical protein
MKGGRAYDDEFKLPVFLTAKNLEPFITADLLENSKPMIYKYKKQQFIGYKAVLLPLHKIPILTHLNFCCT